MHEVMVLVTLQVDSDEQLTFDESQKAGVQAVRDAMVYVGNRMGYAHDYSDFASIGLVDVEPIVDGDAK